MCKIASAKRDDSATKRQLQEDSNDIGITHKYLEVALLADEQTVAFHGNLIEDFLLLIGSIVSIKTLYMLWTVRKRCKHWKLTMKYTAETLLSRERWEL